ncbi:MAG: glycosyl hydrolase family 65 protein, partial [Promethearchaeota archaeon]
NYLLNHGMELLLEIARFWASSAVLNEKTHRYYIPKVMGPDEFHEKYPDSKEYGLINNSYTNIMVSWLFSVVNEIFNELSDLEKESLTSKLHLSSEELDLWKDLGQHLALEISENNILAQYKDYFKLKELNWDAYRSKYGNIKRMDRILKAEGLSIDEYKVSKQADALMPWYLFNQEKVKSILSKLNYPVSDNMLSKNFRYYLERTSHGSTLSLIVHSYLANLIGDSEISYNYFITALKSDYNDIQGGTTAEGIHTGVMGGTIYLTLFGYAGLDLNSHIVHLKPRLPSYWQKISFNFNFQGSRYFIELNHSIIKIRIENPKQNDQLVFLNDQKIYATINWRSYPC